HGTVLSQALCPPGAAEREPRGATRLGCVGTRTRCVREPAGRRWAPGAAHGACILSDTGCIQVGLAEAKGFESCTARAGGACGSSSGCTTVTITSVGLTPVDVSLCLRPCRRMGQGQPRRGGLVHQ